MKTVLFVNSSGAQYFRRSGGLWRLIDHPGENDRLWVIADLPEETLEAFRLPLLFLRDRSNFIDRRISAAFPQSQYRSATVISSSLFKPSTAVLNGLTTAEAVTNKLEKMELPIAGVWGMAMLITMMSKRLNLANVVMAIPNARYLRILVLKDGIPVLTRCVHRYSEDENDDESDAGEILRTSQHLENRRIFEHDAIPPILYLGDISKSGTRLTNAGLNLLPLPASLAAKGDAGYLHPILNYVASSPRGQLAPLQLRARHLAGTIRRSAYVGIAACLLTTILYTQEDFRALLDLRSHGQTQLANLQYAVSEREQLIGRISASGKDPALVRQTTRFAVLEMDTAPTPDEIFKFTAAAIKDLPQVRIGSMTFRLPRLGERFCQGHTVIELPLLNSIDLPLPTGSKPQLSDGEDRNIPARHAELQFTVLLPGDLTPTAQVEIRKHISTVLKAGKGVQLMQDPAAFSLVNTLKGGIGIDTTSTDNLWCMSLAWKTTGDIP